MTSEIAIAESARKYKLHLVREMLRIRRLEEKSAEMYSATKIAAFCTCISVKKLLAWA